MSCSVLTPADRDALAAHAGEWVLFDEPMSRRTTLRIGGPADALIAPNTVELLGRVVRECASRGIEVTPIGGGSNLLVRDGGIRGVALATRNLRGLERVGDRGVRVQAGVSTGKLLSAATDWGLGGVEFLGGVPGSVGGGLVMNAGTYLGEFKDVTTKVSSIELCRGRRVERDNAACQFVYRGSALPNTEVVIEALLELSTRPTGEIRETVRALRDDRRRREPKKVSNAGSVFKNPPGDHAGRLLDVIGFKGTRVGAAECSPLHANWFVNTGGASCADMLALIERARQQVRQHHGVELVLEWKIIGHD